MTNDNVIIYILLFKQMFFKCRSSEDKIAIHVFYIVEAYSHIAKLYPRV